jgi:hypothetical protein
VDILRAHPTLDAQSILESVLSREWEDRSTTSSRAAVRQRIVRTLSRDEAGWGSWLQDNLQELSVWRLSDTTLVRWLQRLEYISLVFDREKQRLREMPQAIDAGALTQAFTELSEPGWLHAYAEGDAFPLDDMTDEQRERFERLRAACDRVARTYQPHELAHPDSLADVSGLARALLRLLYPFAERRIERAIDEAAERRHLVERLEVRRDLFEQRRRACGRRLRTASQRERGGSARAVHHRQRDRASIHRCALEPAPQSFELLDHRRWLALEVGE